MYFYKVLFFYFIHKLIIENAIIFYIEFSSILKKVKNDCFTEMYKL